MLQKTIKGSLNSVLLLFLCTNSPCSHLVKIKYMHHFKYGTPEHCIIKTSTISLLSNILLFVTKLLPHKS